MTKTLIYSCVFFNQKYIDLIHLLLKSYTLFGNAPNEVDYLIICSPHFQKDIQAIFDTLHIKGKIWCLDLKTKFQAGYSRLKIFAYQHIDQYKKILYLDCDILVTNSISNILNFQLKNKLYSLEEGNTKHVYFGKQFFDKNPNLTAFTSGILLFNNHIIIKDLFRKILSHIQNHIHKKLPIPVCLDQPFIIYHAVKDNLYDNQKLINIVVNNPSNFNHETISHFPGGPGDYERKIVKMSQFMKNVIFNVNKKTKSKTKIVLLDHKYQWGDSQIEFLENGKMNAFGPGEYKFIDKYLVKCDFGGREHLLKFNENYSRFISIRKDDFEVISGDKYKRKQIPKIVMQTDKNKPEKYIMDIISEKCPGWKYVHFVDSEIIQYLKENPIQEFPNIIKKFNSFTMGQHKADLFRYYFLYLNGGIFLDSDAIFNENINNILKSYDSVFVKSFMPNTHLFNGFIATYPKNPIIYDALKHAYHTENEVLQVGHSGYHYLCEELWRIYHRHNLPNMKIYQEHNRMHEGYGGSVILDENGDKIISHYFENKKIPVIIETSYESPNSLKNKNLIYSCMFFNKSYIELFKLLLLSYNFYKGKKSDITYLIICDKIFNDEIYILCNYISIDFIIWNLDINTKFEAACCRLNIFDYQYVKNFEKILYLDCDILINNNINRIFKLKLEDCIYAVKENYCPHSHFGIQAPKDGNFKVYNDSIYHNINTNMTFSSGILLFNNSEKIKNMFDKIRKDISGYVKQCKPIPGCLDQPFIVVNCIKNEIINNTDLTELCCFNPVDVNNKFHLLHFSGGVGIAEPKLKKMTEYFNDFHKRHKISYNFLENKIYQWGHGEIDITFLENGEMNGFGKGYYYFINEHFVIANFGGHNHFIKFSDDYTSYVSIRQNDFIMIKGNIIKPSIPKTILQLSKNEPEQYIVDMIKHYSPDYKYIHFKNNERNDFFKSNPSKFFPNIIQVHNSFKREEHKADLFRYFYLYVKGGAYLDYDAMIYTNIDNIVLHYDSVFVKTFPTNEFGPDLISNAYLFVKPKNPVIYKALINLYNVNPSVLTKNYAWVCKDLLKVYNKIKPKNCRLLHEVDYFFTSKINNDEQCCKIFDENNNLLMIHYPVTKKIPDNYWGGDKKHICVIQKNYTDYNNYNTEEINEFDPKVLIGYDCPNSLIRVGPTEDGGYVMVDGFEYDHFLSCGIAGDIRFEVALLNKYPHLKCDAFDGTIDNFPHHNKNINWTKKNIGYINSEKITNLKPYIKNYKNIFLKMDIEGSEFNWIDSMSLDDLNCFSQIVMEIHWPFDKYRCEMLKKLNQTHYIVHIHGNNYCDRDIPEHLPSGRTYDGTLTINHSNCPTIKLPEVFEITYIRKSNFTDNLTKIEKKYPTSLDSPNNPNAKDIDFTILV